MVAIVNGLRYSWNHRGFRTMLAYFALGNVFLAPALVLVTPLVLSFAGTTQVAQVALGRGGGRHRGRHPHVGVGRPAQAPDDRRADRQPRHGDRAA